MSLTFEGLNQYLAMFNEGYNSNTCFVAMAFSDETKGIRNAIRSAIEATGFVMDIVDEDHIPDETTVFDRIISGIKKCKFCIADFYDHRNGVYFEAGYAYGKGKSVILTCLEDQMEKRHFDVQPLQTVVYKTPEDLKEKLIYKIEAMIKG